MPHDLFGTPVIAAPMAGGTSTAAFVEAVHRAGGLGFLAAGYKSVAAMQFLQAILGTLLIWSLHETPALNTWIDESFQHFWRSISVSSREQEP